jgi:hypothetical protein
MSTSYNAGVILGVTLTDIGLKIEDVKEKFEVHDKKGNPTGKFDFEVKIKLSFKDKEVILDHFYPEDDIEKFLNLKLDKDFKIIMADYDNPNSDNILIGKRIVENGYNEWWCLEEIRDDSFSIVYDKIKEIADVKPKKYFYFNVT